MTTPTPRQTSIFDEMLDALLKWLASLWVELLLLAPLVATGVWTFMHFGPVVAVLATVGLLVAVLVPRRSRMWLRRVLRRARVRRQLVRAFVDTRGVLATRCPRVKKVVRTDFGDVVTLVLARGTSASDFHREVERLASSLRVREVRVRRDATSGNLVQLVIVRRDPFINVQPCPLLTTNQTSIGNPVTVGVDEDGSDVKLSLTERAAVLIAGEPGSGKSVALSVLLAHAALDPSVVLWLFDGKLVELQPWRACAHRFVGPDLNETIAALEELRGVMDERYRHLAAQELRKVTAHSGFARHVVVFDELALYVASPNKQLSQRVTELLRDLVARGRASGVIVLSATQRSSSDVIPSSLRDLHSCRWAMRCSTRDSSDCILGSGWATRGFSADVIDAGSRGEGFLLHEGGVPVRLRTYNLTDDDVRVIVERAKRLRDLTREVQW